MEFYYWAHTSRELIEWRIANYQPDKCEQSDWFIIDAIDAASAVAVAAIQSNTMWT